MQNSSGFGTCRKCGKRIIWITTTAGKKMPCDSNFVYYKAKEGGKDRIVLTNGQVVAGEIVNRPEDATGDGHISHFATCSGYERSKK